MNTKYLLSMIITILLIIIMYGGYYFKQYTRKKNIENKKLLLEKQSEISGLELKVNAAFEEVIDLARENSPNFLPRFKEVYPNFCERMIALHPDIRNSELIFCGYLLLGFSTKDIANYTFVAPETVRMRKYRLRKKLDIPTDKDIYIWIQNLNTSDLKS